MVYLRRLCDLEIESLEAFGLRTVTLHRSDVRPIKTRLYNSVGVDIYALDPR